MNAQIAAYWATPARRRTIASMLAVNALFSALLAVMFYLRNQSRDWPAPFEFASVLMAAGMAMFAVCAGVTAAVGAAALRPEDKEPAVRWIAIAIICWLTFLFLEIVEWVRLVYLVNLGPRTTFGASFLALTGVHWLAAVACVCWFTYVALDVSRRDMLAAALFSHFLAFWWIILVGSLYLVNFNALMGI